LTGPFNFYLSGIEPKWEDSANINGGKWILFVKGNAEEQLQHLWMHLV
jgi:hypothetical protein